MSTHIIGELRQVLKYILSSAYIKGYYQYRKCKTTSSPYRLNSRLHEAFKFGLVQSEIDIYRERHKDVSMC